MLLLLCLVSIHFAQTVLQDHGLLFDSAQLLQTVEHANHSLGTLIVPLGYPIQGGTVGRESLQWATKSSTREERSTSGRTIRRVGQRSWR